MSISDEIRGQVRRRASFACEFCGVSERDTGGELTLDHYQPKAKGGADTLANLLYCCIRCNQYKADYWQEKPEDAILWNPRIEPASVHFLELDDGTLQSLTLVGVFTLRRLRLNRPPLVAHRLWKRQQSGELRSLARYSDLVQLLEQTNAELSELVAGQRKLLDEQRELLQLLLRSRL